MTIIDFALLTITEQLNALHINGVYLGKRKTGKTRVVLYQYGKLYVEIHYKKYRQTVDRIRCSEETDILTPYLDSVYLDPKLLAI